MGRKASGNVPVTRRMAPEAAARLQALERLGYSLEEILESFVEREAPEADTTNQPTLALLEAIRFLYSRGGLLPVASSHVIEEVLRCYAGQVLYPNDPRFQVSPALRSAEGWPVPEHFRQALLVMRKALEALHADTAATQAGVRV